MLQRGGVKYVNYVGSKYGKDKEKYFKEADIFVFPTFYGNECFPLVLLEAMQYKVPIITTDEGGIPDVVQNGVNGYVCERKDSVSLANSIEILLKNKERCSEFGENGYKIFKEKFTLDEFNKNITKALRNII